jgi:hypothetical protein
MDLLQMIHELRERQKHLARVITALERLQRTHSGAPAREKPQPRRGRKFMSDQERREVSERMKKYWSARKARGNGNGQPKKVGPA